MKITGISSLDHAPQVVAEWLNLLCEDLEWGDNKKRAYLLLRESLHALRDYLTVDEAADFSAQLPLLVRGIFFDGWVPSKTPEHPRGKQDFMNRVARAFDQDPLDDTEEAVVAVFDLLRRELSEGELDQVAKAMRKPLRDLFH